jgi:purine catabolism regulator
MRRSYREARDAVRLGLLVLGPRQVARAADLGVYRLLLRLRDSGELEEFCRSTLGPLIGEERTGGALLETLEVFFACNGNLSEAARRLNLHRNSLIYRLNRAHELLGQDLEDPEVRLALQLALKARRVLAL